MTSRHTNPLLRHLYHFISPQWRKMVLDSSSQRKPYWWEGMVAFKEVPCSLDCSSISFQFTGISLTTISPESMHVSCWPTILHHLQVIHTPKANLFIYECSSRAYIDSISVIHCFGSPLLKIGSTKELIGVSVDRPSTPNFVISVRCKVWWLIHQRAKRQLLRRNLESGFDRRIRNSEEFIDDLRSEHVHGSLTYT